MQLNRTSLLAAALLVMVGVLISSELKSLFPQAERTKDEASLNSKVELLPGKNAISQIKISRADDGALYATLEYYYIGDMHSPKIRVLASSPDEYFEMYWREEQTAEIKKGRNTIKLEVMRPLEPAQEFTSEEVIFYLFDEAKRFERPASFAAKKVLQHKIAWPTQLKYEKDRELTRKTNTELYEESIALIDRASNNDLSTAKLYLERILIKTPYFIDAYPELARVAMKTQWGAIGLKQAENYLLMGLKHEPTHANSRILLGYVYTHQKRYDDALREFKISSEMDTKNLWLWANWGELYKRKGDTANAIKMYEKAVDGSRPFNTYDRARLDAYQNLFDLLSETMQTARADMFYAKRADEFEDIPCLRSEYAAFKLNNNQDFESALTQSRKAMTNGCNTDSSRKLMALANYVGWANTQGARREELFTQAQVLFPSSPELVYTLAAEKETIKILKELIKSHLEIDMRDNENLTALSYALAHNNTDVAERLIDIGANAFAAVGHEEYPIAMVPIIYQHPEGVILMQEKGVNFQSIKFQGKPLVDFAEKTDNRELIKAVRKNIKT